MLARLAIGHLEGEEERDGECGCPTKEEGSHVAEPINHNATYCGTHHQTGAECGAEPAVSRATLFRGNCIEHIGVGSGTYRTARHTLNEAEEHEVPGMVVQ